VGCGVIRVSEIEEWNLIKDLHIKTVEELALPRSVIHSNSTTIITSSRFRSINAIILWLPVNGTHSYAG
jgi:hypothetical protein